MGLTKTMESIDYKTLLEISRSTATVRSRDELQAFIDDKVKPCFDFNNRWNMHAYNPDLNTLELLFKNKITQENSESVLAFMLLFQAEGIFRTVIETCEIVHHDESWMNSPKTIEIDKIVEQFWRDFNIKYCLSIALRSFGKVIGVFHVFFDEHKTFTESQLQLFKSLAELVAIALVNVLANEKALEREREKALLLSTSEEMATIRERADLRRVMTKTIKPLIYFDDAFIIVVSEDHTQYNYFLIASDDQITNDNDSLTVNPMLPVGGTPYEYLLTLPSPHAIHTGELPERYSDYSDGYLGGETNLNNLVGFHMQGNDCVIGLFLLSAECQEQSLESKLSLYKAIANQIVVAVGTILTNEKNARLAEELRQRAEQLARSNEAIARTSERLITLSDLSAFLGQVTIEAARQLDADAGHLTVFDEKCDTFQTMALFEANELVEDADIPAWAVTEENTFWHELRELRRPRQICAEMQADLFRQGSIKYYQERDHKRLLAVPLFAADKPLGYLGLSFLDSAPIDDQRTELVTTFAHQAAFAIQLTRLADEAEQAAALDERNRIAREIHDVLAQGFTGVIFQLETAKRVFGETTPAKVSEYVSRSIELAREGLAQARRSVQALRPPAEDLQLDLPRLLREKLIVLTIGTDIETEFSTMGTPVQFPPETMLNLLRIGQEAITNALRHSEASRITVDLDYDEGVSLRVTDNGIGFETLEVGQSGGGYGLRGMRERAAAINARLNIQSKSGSGTSVTVSLPKED